MRKLPLILFALFFISSCDRDHVGEPLQMQTYVPVYGTLSEIHQISIEPQKPTDSAGKIYAYGNYIFQNDVNTGIHIIDNSNHDNPVKVAFLNLPLNTEIAVKDDYLYANNFTDLVVFDISNPANPKLVRRLKEVFPPVNQEFPPYTNVYFQCADKSKGIIVRWEEKDIPTPKCRR